MGYIANRLVPCSQCFPSLMAFGCHCSVDFHHPYNVHGNAYLRLDVGEVEVHFRPPTFFLDQSVQGDAVSVRFGVIGSGGLDITGWGVG